MTFLFSQEVARGILVLISIPVSAIALDLIRAMLGIEMSGPSWANICLAIAWMLWGAILWSLMAWVKGG